MEESKTSFCSSEFPWARERISSQFIDSLGTRSQKGFPAPVQMIYTYLLKEINDQE
jgi:hypothetical protein